MTLDMLEAELQGKVIELARWLGFLAYHTHDSRRSARGFPDLVLIHPTSGALLFVELKSARGGLSAEQRAWLDALRGGGHVAAVWRPRDWHDETIATALRAAARTRGKR